MTHTLIGRMREAHGFSLVEILVGLMILAVGLLGLAAAAGVAARQVYLGKVYAHRWAATQAVAERIMSDGYDGATSDSAVIQGYRVHWTVGAGNPREVIVVLERTNMSRQAVEDTTLFYLARPSP